MAGRSSFAERVSEHHKPNGQQAATGRKFVLIRDRPEKLEVSRAWQQLFKRMQGSRRAVIAAAATAPAQAPAAVSEWA